MHHDVDVLLLGDTNPPETQPVTTAIVERVPAHRLRRATDLATVRSLAARGDWFPDLIIVCQTWPDQFTTADVQELLTRFPLARLVCCYGPWCDSDGRTRTIWPLATRVPAAWSARRLDAELAVLRGDRPLLPLTASRDEIFEFDCTPDFPAGEMRRRVSFTSPG